MDVFTSPKILEAEQAYKDASKHVTNVAKAVESQCQHRVWCGRDSKEGISSTYICLHCRMEVHIENGSLLLLQNGPKDSIILSEKQCKVSDIFQLRIKGDTRAHFDLKRYLISSWPVRAINAD